MRLGKGIVVKGVLPITAIVLYPFIFVNTESRRWKFDRKALLNHERIHVRQALELFILPFYIWYLIEYLIRLAIHRNHNIAYRTISFEAEAFLNERDFDYLENRKPYSFLRYLKK